MTELLILAILLDGKYTIYKIKQKIKIEAFGKTPGFDCVGLAKPAVTA